MQSASDRDKMNILVTVCKEGNVMIASTVNAFRKTDTRDTMRQREIHRDTSLIEYTLQCTSNVELYSSGTMVIAM